MPRLPDWPRRLVEFVEAHAETPFSWGGHDCVLFAAGAVAAVTGEDPAAEIRGRYRTRLGALRLIRARGFDDLAGVLAARFGQVAPAMARRGDLGFVAGGEGPSIVVCVGDRFVGPREPRGLAHLPFSAATAAFRVG